MEGNTLREKLVSIINNRVYIETNSYHIGYLIHKGYLTYVGEDFIELDAGNKIELIPLKEIRVVTIK